MMKERNIFYESEKRAVEKVDKLSEQLKALQKQFKDYMQNTAESVHEFTMEREANKFIDFQYFLPEQSDDFVQAAMAVSAPGALVAVKGRPRPGKKTGRQYGRGQE
jgi:hypothetical protein